jgi:hypothetical protein
MTPGMGIAYARAAALAAAIWLGLVAASPAQGLLDDLVDLLDGVTDTLTETVDGVTGAVGGVVGGVGEIVGGGQAGAQVYIPPPEEEQAFALQAVRSGRAMPLDDMMFIAQLNEEGEVVDVHLIEVREILLYQFTFLASDGEIFDRFFYAATGIPVR